MPGVDVSQPILAGSANYQAGDWLNASASGKLDLLASADLRRGINLGLGAEALVELSGALRKFLAIDLNAQASAAARVQAQVQVPLDLFSEAGLAIRLQAIAEAAAGVSLGVGLNVGDFLALAGADPRMRGAPLKLLQLLLEPDGISLSGGVKAKVAASAMAYANFLVTGSLMGAKPGFLVAAEAGLGLEAGAGFQVHASFGLNNPHRFVRRSIDIAVEETLRLVGEHLPDETARAMLAEMRAPAKIAFRAAFELGAALAENGGSFSAGAGPQLAQRLTTVVLEEGQRFLLGTLTTFAIQSFQRLLDQAGVPQAEWDASLAERRHLADRLRAIPEDAFEASAANRRFWVDLIADVTSLAARFQSIAAGSQWREQMALVWSAVQLLFRATERVSEASIRGTLIGLPPHTQRAPFDQPLAAQPPATLAAHINAALGRAANSSLSEGLLVDFLVRDTVLTPLTQAAPQLKKVLDVVFGPSASGGVAAAKVLLRQVGSFVPGPDGAADSEATLRALLDGLRAYVDTRLARELVPVIRQSLTSHPELQLYLDEVLLPVLSLSTDLLMEQVLTWSQKGAVDQMALREACSSVLMKLTGRSLVVSLDLLLNTALEQIHREFQAAAAHVDAPGGMAAFLSQATGLRRDFLAEVLREVLLISSDTFQPLPAARRERIRSLLFQLTDVLPTRGEDFVDQLRDDFFVPNVEAAVALAQEAGGLIVDNLGSFLTSLFDRAGALILEELQEFLQAAEAQVRQWLQSLEQFAQELAASILALARQIAELGEQVARAWAEAFDALESLCRTVAGTGSRSGVRSKIKAALVSEAIGTLEANDVYRSLPREARDLARGALGSVADGVLNAKLFDALWDTVAAVAQETAELMEDIRGLDLDGNLTAQIGDLILDRLEDLVHDHLGGDDPHIDLAIRVSFTVDVPFVGRVGFEKSIDLGRVCVPISAVLSGLRSAVQGVSAFEDATRLVADRVRVAIEAAGRLQVSKTEHAAAVEEQAQVSRELAASHRDAYAIEILSPTAAGFYETPTIDVEVFLKGVPASYLGLGGCEQRRVHVFLNHDELEPSDFLVEERGDAVAAKDPLVVLGGRVGVGAVDPGLLRPALVTATKSRFAVVRYQPGAAVGPWGQTLLLEQAPGRDEKERLDSFRRQQGKTVAPALDGCQQAVFAARGTRKTSTNSSRDLSAAARVGSRVGRGSRDALKGGRPARTAPPAISLGRVRTALQRTALAAHHGTGLLLRLQLPTSRFLAGTNTLVVAIVPGRGERLSQSVSFAVFARVSEPPPKVSSVLGKDLGVPFPAGMLVFGSPVGGAPEGTPRRRDRSAVTREERMALVRERIEHRELLGRKTTEALETRARLARARGLGGPAAHRADGVAGERALRSQEMR